ncbi:MAG: hypothetical protein ABIS38_01720 [Sphingomicrobium sp.]
MRITILLLAATLSLRPAVANAAPAAPLTGVWQGTLGAEPVRACFNDRQGAAFGAYFYLSRLVTIPLIKDDKGALLFSEGWPEKAQAPRWALTQAGPDALGGIWSQGQRKLPVRLTRVPLNLGEDETPCGSLAFEQPRLNRVRIVRTRAAKDGLAYTRLTLDQRGHFPSVSVESFALDGDSPAVRRINAILHQPFVNGADNWLGCIRSSLDSSAFEGEHNEMVEPRMVTRKWLALNQHWDGFCGGAHPDASDSPRLFDRASGSEIELFDWFTNAAVKREHFGGESDDAITLRPPFKAVIMAGWKGDKDCREAMGAEDFWSVELTRSGFVFTPLLAHVVQACSEAFALPFANAAPFLTVAGKTEAAALKAEISRR